MQLVLMHNQFFRHSGLPPQRETAAAQVDPAGLALVANAAQRIVLDDDLLPRRETCDFSAGFDHTGADFMAERTEIMDLA